MLRDKKIARSLERRGVKPDDLRKKLDNHRLEPSDLVEHLPRMRRQVEWLSRMLDDMKTYSQCTPDSRCQERVEAIVEEAGGTMASIAKTTVLLQSMDDFKAMNGIYSRYFESDPPARAAFEVGALPLGALVEIEAVAFLA
jgi:hypothetical protein